MGATGVGWGCSSCWLCPTQGDFTRATSAWQLRCQMCLRASERSATIKPLPGGWGLLGTTHGPTSHARRPNVPVTFSFWPLNSKASCAPYSLRKQNPDFRKGQDTKARTLLACGLGSVSWDQSSPPSRQPLHIFWLISRAKGPSGPQGASWAMSTFILKTVSLCF